MLDSADAASLPVAGRALIVLPGQEQKEIQIPIVRDWKGLSCNGAQNTLETMERSDVETISDLDDDSLSDTERIKALHEQGYSDTKIARQIYGYGNSRTIDRVRASLSL